ncbi:hypothetical protein MTO96_027647 [Rhipicephalus appendiculatus]
MTAPGSSGPNMTSPSTTQVTTPGSSVPDMTSPNTTQSREVTERTFDDSGRSERRCIRVGVERLVVFARAIGA